MAGPMDKSGDAGAANDNHLAELVWKHFREQITQHFRKLSKR